MWSPFRAAVGRRSVSHRPAALRRTCRSTLPDGLVGAHGAVRLAPPRPAAAPGRPRAQAAVGQPRDAPRARSRAARSAFSAERPGAHRAAEHRRLQRAAAPPRSTSAVRPPDHAHHRDAPQARERPHVLGPVRRAHQVQDHVRAVAVREPRAPRRRSAPSRATIASAPELAHRLGLRSRAHRPDGPRPELPGHLDRRRAHAARGGVDEHHLALAPAASGGASDCQAVRKTSGTAAALTRSMPSGTGISWPAGHGDRARRSRRPPAGPSPGRRATSPSTPGPDLRRRSRTPPGPGYSLAPGGGG